jgi:eukaryotic-like serine/threonine-protein kinase
MPICPQCHRQFPAGQKRCPDDDAPLEATAAEIAVAIGGTMVVPAAGAGAEIAHTATMAGSAVTERKAIGTAETAAFDAGDHAKALAAAKEVLAKAPAAGGKQDLSSAGTAIGFAATGAPAPSAVKSTGAGATAKPAAATDTPPKLAAAIVNAHTGAVLAMAPPQAAVVLGRPKLGAGAAAVSDPIAAAAAAMTLDAVDPATGAPVAGAGVDTSAGTNSADSARTLDDYLDDRSSELQAGTKVGEYVVTAKLGEGGMGAVYAGAHPIIGKKVAIKVLSGALRGDRDIVRRFVAEARAVNQIGHQNIIDIFAFGTLPDGREYFVMEYLPGRSLEAELRSRGALPLRECLALVEEVLSALRSAHEVGIIHRDLKPDNIYLADLKDGSRTVKILDFGIAKLTGPDSGLTKTRTGMAMGTPEYMSPEQCRGINVDHRTDIYAMGVILFRLVTGKLPFHGQTAFDVIAKQVTADPPRPSTVRSVAGPIEEVILRCLAKNPDDRYQTAKALLEAFKAALVESKADLSAPATSDANAVTTPEAPAVDTGALHRAAPTGTPDGAATVPMVEPPVPSTTAAVAPAPAATPRRSPVTLIVVVALVMVAGLVVAVLARGGGGAGVGATLPVDAGPRVVLAPTGVTPQTQPASASAPARGELVVKTNLDDATVTLDGKPVGKGRTAVVKDLAEGSYIVEVSREKHQSQSRTIRVEGGKSVAEAFVLVKAPRGGPGPGAKAPSGPTKTPAVPPKPVTHKDDTIDVFGK